ncbi:hypothetical protein LX87_04566 [Larkinella arboricola]|uniref:Uncharacterized protein n=1 Tax=Larkinella arboricola TaxID=643671 RepID=A0A327WNH3_LARAB|nr:hypothetical protein LX87_04566 [Larkinella arboricola]
MIQLPSTSSFTTLLAGISGYFQKIFRPVIDQECLILQRFAPSTNDRHNFLSHTNQLQKAFLPIRTDSFNSQQGIFDRLP